jgi:uncharacterized protein
MRIKVKLHPGADEEKIKKLKKDEYEVWIKARPLEGKANIFLMKLLKRHFKAQEVRILLGQKSRDKIVEIII